MNPNSTVRGSSFSATQPLFSSSLASTLTHLSSAGQQNTGVWERDRHPSSARTLILGFPHLSQRALTCLWDWEAHTTTLSRISRDTGRLEGKLTHTGKLCWFWCWFHLSQDGGMRETACVGCRLQLQSYSSFFPCDLVSATLVITG